MSAENAADQVVQTKDSAGGVEVHQQEEGFRVFFGNLNFKTTEDELREFAAKAGGEITSASIPIRQGRRPPGYGFVNFKTQEGATNAVDTLKGTELHERKVTLQLARNQEEQDAHRAEVKERRAARDAKRQEESGEVKEGGEGVEGEEKPKRKSKPKRAARRRVPGEEGDETLVEGDTTAGNETSDASPIVPKKKNTKSRKPKEARIDAAEGDEGVEAAEKPKREPRERKPRQELTDELSLNTIFVSNLPFSVDDAALASIFTNLSIKVRSAKVVLGVRKGRGGKAFRASRGFGFVEVEDSAQQHEAVEKVEGSLVGERKINAKVANEMKAVEVEEVKEDVKVEDGAVVETATA